MLVIMRQLWGIVHDITKKPSKTNDNIRVSISLSISPPHLAIAAVEGDTGHGEDTLRIWERRYGFPQPLCDEFDERSYPLSQVEKLRAIKCLLDQGFRAGKVVAMPLEDLQRISMAKLA